MADHLEATYKQGILRPLEQLVALAENQRREELRWLANESAPYAGEWVALDGRSLVAHGLKLADVISAAKAVGVTSPLFATVPRDQDTPFAGW